MQVGKSFFAGDARARSGCFRSDSTGQQDSRGSCSNCQDFSAVITGIESNTARKASTGC